MPFDPVSYVMGAKSAGGGGGGGGSDEFKVVTLTVVNTKADTFATVTHAVVIENDKMVDMCNCPEGTTVVSAVLYKNSAELIVDAETISSISGNIEGSLEDGFTITGNATITCEGWGNE